MPLEKLTILPENSGPIVALFNPERYTVSKSVQLAEVAIPGLDAPVVQYVRGQNEKVSMELFFDTTDLGMVDPVKDVRIMTAQVYQLLKGQRRSARAAAGTAGLGNRRTAYQLRRYHLALPGFGKHQRRVQPVQSGRGSAAGEAQRELPRGMDDRAAITGNATALQ